MFPKHNQIVMLLGFPFLNLRPAKGCLTRDYCENLRFVSTLIFESCKSQEKMRPETIQVSKTILSVMFRVVGVTYQSCQYVGHEHCSIL